MHKFILLLVPFLTVGCVGAGPNTQRGAVAGGIAGAVIGNNTRLGLVEGVILGSIAGAVLGNSVDQENSTIYVSPPPPPQPYAEVIPPMPGDGPSVWVPGYWRWNGSGYYWVYGYWSQPVVRYWAPPPYHTPRIWHHHRPYWRR